MRVASWNLRFDSIPDNITVQQSLAALPDPLAQFKYLNITTEQPWSTRRLRVAELLLSEGIVLAGFQEALVRQVDDLLELLGDDWSYIGVGREDGLTAGEFSPIFYKKSAISLISNDTFWLSLTPFEPSKFPGAGSVRICTLGQFQLKTGSQQKFTYFNTHLDDQSDDGRKVGASLILTRARFEAVTTNAPIFIQGDFNSAPTGSDSGAYSIITGAQAPVAINATFAAKFSVGSQALNFKGLDLRAQVPRRSVSKNFATFTGFTLPDDTSDWQRIDFIFGGSNAGWKATQYKVLSVLSDDGTLVSDHRPVFADIDF